MKRKQYIRLLKCQRHLVHRWMLNRVPKSCNRDVSRSIQANRFRKRQMLSYCAFTQFTWEINTLIKLAFIANGIQPENPIHLNLNVLRRNTYIRPRWRELRLQTRTWAGTQAHACTAGSGWRWWQTGVALQQHKSTQWCQSLPVPLHQYPVWQGQLRWLSWWPVVNCIKSFSFVTKRPVACTINMWWS